MKTMTDICGKRDVNSIIDSLPLKVTNYMFRVGKLVGILTPKIFERGISPSYYYRDELLFYGDAAFYHDLGKAFVPVSVLIKPVRFTKKEMEIMQKHTLCAQALFDDIERGHLVGVPELLIRPARDSAAYLINGGLTPCAARVA